MKGYEEMTRSVLDRAKEEKAKQNRTRRVMISVAACFSVVVMAVLATTQIWLPEDSQTILSTENTGQSTGKTRLSVFSVSAAEYKTMIKDVQMPSGLMHVRDVKGFTELERVFIRREEMELVEEFTEGAWRASRMRCEKNNAIFVMGLSECLMVMPENIDQVAEYSASASDGHIFSCVVNPGKDKITGEIYRGIEILWQPTEEQVDRLLQYPDSKLSQIKDVVTLTVNFTDGSVEVVVIDVNVDDAGYIYMTYRGAK